MGASHRDREAGTGWRQLARLGGSLDPRLRLRGRQAPANGDGQLRLRRL